jgi:hypothetical protein
MYISSDVKRRKKWRRRLFTFYTLPPWRVLILPRQTEKEKREMREIRKLVRKGTSAYITALANAVHTHNGVSSYTQFPYISQEVNASCMYRVEAYILYYTCCCLSLICWGRATQWRGDNST